MNTREIPRSEWGSFLQSFTRRNVERHATVEVLEPRLGAQYEARGLPLQGIFLERSGTTITIVLGAAPSLFEHPVGSPARVWVETSDEGLDESLEIEATNDTKTIVELSRRDYASA